MINFLSTLTDETQICVVLVLVILVALLSGMIGYMMGFDRAIEYIRRTEKGVKQR